MYDFITTALQKVGRFSQQELETIMAHLGHRHFGKVEVLLKEGSICQCFYFLESGSVRHYCTTEKGDEVTLNLFLEGDWILDYKSFTAQKPSTATIEACEPSTVFTLQVHDLHQLMKTSDAFFQLGRVFQFGVEPQENNSFKISPKERYVHLLATKPQLIQRFPLKYIASYLDMTPETLSRVRRSLA